jgi:hypothetical protein
MNAIMGLTPKQLRRAADIQERILALQEELASVLGTEQLPTQPVAYPTSGPQPGKKRRLSAEGLANIRAGVIKRERARALAEAKGLTRPAGKAASAANDRRAQAMKARWAAARASGKSRL